MKIKQSEKNLLIVLGVLLVIFLYIMFVYFPQNREREELKESIKTINTSLDENRVALDSYNDQYSQQIEKIESSNNDGNEGIYMPTSYDLSLWTDKFFDELEQDEMIMLLSRFIPVEAYVNDSLYIGTTTFTTEKEVISSNYSYDMIKDVENAYAHHNYVEVDVVGKVDVFAQFIENIKNYKYPIFITSIDIEPFDPVNHNPTIDFTSNNPYEEISVEYIDNGFRYKSPYEEYIKGTITLDFIEVPALKEYNSEDINYFEVVEVDMTGNPFVPFAGFYKPNIVEGTTEKELIDNYKFTTLYGFENDDYFFVGKPKEEVRGSVALTDKSYSGQKALKLNYNFSKSPNENKVYIVNGENNINVTSKIQGLLLQLYTNDTIPHTVGVVVRDNTGRETEIDFVTGLSKGWQEVPIVLPDDMRYPLNIQRFYVKDNGDKEILNGSIIFDDLIIADYTDEYKEQLKKEEIDDRISAFEAVEVVEEENDEDGEEDEAPSND